MKRNRYIAFFILLPISKIYGLVVAIRNLFFKWGVFKQYEFDIPVIVVGNIAMGGTGKTPHTEYIVNTFRTKYNVAILSRGYKRSTKGFVVATPNSTPWDIGDEPYQMYRKFGGNIKVAVCESRKEGINKLREIDPEINLVILDDAFQHRYVKPKISVVLTEYSRPAFEDYLLPYGRLREPVDALKRADVIIVTKCPKTLKPVNQKMFKKRLISYEYQQLYFSEYNYGGLIPVFPESVTYIPDLSMLSSKDSLIALSGIANPKMFNRYVKSFNAKTKTLHYPDHHSFTRDDFKLIISRYNSMQGEKYIITTEKDAVRLANCPYFPTKLKSKIFYIPITVNFKDYYTGDIVRNLDRLIREKPL